MLVFSSVFTLKGRICAAVNQKSEMNLFSVDCSPFWPKCLDPQTNIRSNMENNLCSTLLLRMLIATPNLRNLTEVWMKMVYTDISMTTEAAVNTCSPRSKLKGFTLEINALDAEMSHMVTKRVFRLSSPDVTIFYLILDISNHI